MRAEFLARFGPKAKTIGKREAAHGPESEGGIYTVVTHGAPDETLFRLIEKHYPHFGLLIKEEVDLEGNRLEGIFNILLDPKKAAETGSKLDNLLRGNPIITALDRVLFEEEGKIPAITRNLDKQGLLPEEVGRRLLAKSIENMVEGYKKTEPNSPDKERDLDRWRRGLQILNVEPLSDQELESLLLEKLLIPRFGPPANV